MGRRVADIAVVYLEMHRRRPVARKGEGCGVIVKLVELDLEISDHPEHEFGQECRSVALEQFVQGPSDPVVVERGRLLLSQAQSGWQHRSSPLGHGVQRNLHGKTFA